MLIGFFLAFIHSCIYALIDCVLLANPVRVFRVATVKTSKTFINNNNACNNNGFERFSLFFSFTSTLKLFSKMKKKSIIWACVRVCLSDFVFGEKGKDKRSRERKTQIIQCVAKNLKLHVPSYQISVHIMNLQFLRREICNWKTKNKKKSFFCDMICHLRFKHVRCRVHTCTS